MVRTRVVIVGGGAAGASVARLLSKTLKKINNKTGSKHELLLINPRPFDVWLPSLVRAAVTNEGGIDKVNKGTFTSYDRLFAGGVGRLRVATVTGIETDNKYDGGFVRLHTGEAIPYTVLILAQGSIWEGPLNLPRTKKEIDAHLDIWRSNFQQAKHIVLAGGGAVGAEIAGELKDAYPHKPVTIVQGPNMLLNPAYKGSFRKAVAKGLTDRGVNIVYDDFVDSISPDGSTSGSIVTRNGKTISADLVVPTRGGRPNTSILASSGFTLNENGQVPVDKTFLVKGRHDIFAIGDIADIKEQKQAAKYAAHAAIVAANVVAVLEQHEPSRQYAGSPEVLFIANGKNGGFGYVKGVTLGPWFARMIKSKDLFMATHRKHMGFAT